MQRHGEFFARRAHGGRAPEINHQPLRPVALILQMLAQQLFRQFHPLRMGRLTWHRARVNGEEVAPRGQHIGPPPRGRARGAGRHALPGQRRHQPRPLGNTTVAAPIDMQPRAILAFLDVADKAVNAGQGLGHAGALRQAQILFHAGSACLGPDIGNQPVTPRRVKPVSG